MEKKVRRALESAFPLSLLQESVTLAQAVARLRVELKEGEARRDDLRARAREVEDVYRQLSEPGDLELAALFTAARLVFPDAGIDRPSALEGEHRFALRTRRDFLTIVFAQLRARQTERREQSARNAASTAQRHHHLLTALHQGVPQGCGSLDEESHASSSQPTFGGDGSTVQLPRLHTDAVSWASHADIASLETSQGARTPQTGLKKPHQDWSAKRGYFGD